MTTDPQGRTPTPPVMPAEIERAVEAAQAKKAFDLVVLDLRSLNSFTDYFVICTGQNQRQVKAIAESIEQSLARVHLEPAHAEGAARAEWILLDYFDFVVHIFIPDTRTFYGLERLWGSAERLEVVDVDRRPPVEGDQD